MRILQVGVSSERWSWEKGRCVMKEGDTKEYSGRGGSWSELAASQVHSLTNQSLKIFITSPQCLSLKGPDSGLRLCGIKNWL